MRSKAKEASCMKRVPWGAQRLPGVARQGWGGGGIREKEGNEIGYVREEEGSEVRQRDFAACKIREAKTKSETETERETVNWDWVAVAWQQRSKKREETRGEL